MVVEIFVGITFHISFDEKSVGFIPLRICITNLFLASSIPKENQLDKLFKCLLVAMLTTDFRINPAGVNYFNRKVNSAKRNSKPNF